MLRSFTRPVRPIFAAAFVPAPVVLVLALRGRMPRRVTDLSVLLPVLFALQSLLVPERLETTHG